ncbi:MAG: TIGR01777 family protein [Luteitalea sp.]|nr:TIGR01777 family protein [Luteitalea sp.]
MHIAIAGGTGFLGSALAGALEADGHELVLLTRRSPERAARSMPGALRRIRYVQWNPDDRAADWAARLDGLDALVNLTGGSMAGRRWSPARKALLWDSRIQPVRSLGTVVRAAARPPALVVSASGVGYYGDRGDELLTEASALGNDFVARLAEAWEGEAVRMASDRTAVALLRTAPVLDRRGGALKAMLTPFRLGVGGPMGRGTQYFPWIHLDDWVRLVVWILVNRHDGPFNLAAPEPVANRAFAHALGRALGRPAVLPAPAFALRLALGEMADAMLLVSQRAVPQRALELGFDFRYTDVAAALRACLERE